MSDKKSCFTECNLTAAAAAAATTAATAAAVKAPSWFSETIQYVFWKAYFTRYFIGHVSTPPLLLTKTHFNHRCI